jgi:glutamine amidotransferase
VKTVHLLDYGVGNIGSLQTLFQSLGFAAVLTSDSAVLQASPLVVLPGVGSATTAMRRLHERGLVEPLRARHAAGRALLGICLGAQLPFTFLEESGTDGLGLLPGRVTRLPDRIRFNTGWCRLDWDRTRTNGFGTGLKATDSYFFNHQYAVPAADGFVTVEAEPDIPAMYFLPNICGIQFHPEKSQSPGRLLVRNILRQYHGL